MTQAEVTVGCAASQGGLPGAAAVPSLPCEAQELLGTAHALLASSLWTCSVARWGDRRQRATLGPLAERQKSRLKRSFG